MKSILKYLFVSLFAISLVSCESEEEKVVYIFGHPDLIENIVSDFIEVGSYGLEKQVEIASGVANVSLTDPADNYSETLQNFYEGPYGYYNYELDYEATHVENTIELNSLATGEYETSYVESEDEINNAWVMAEVDEASDFYMLSGTSTRNGFQYSKVYDDSFDSDIELTFEGLEINRITNKIKKGEIKFTYVGESSYGEVYSNNGTIKYSDYTSVLSFDE